MQRVNSMSAGIKLLRQERRMQTNGPTSDCSEEQSDLGPFVCVFFELRVANKRFSTGRVLVFLRNSAH